MTLSVCAYFWHDDRSKNRYATDDVRLLQRMVNRHLTVPHEFVVITDRPELFRDDSEIRAVPIDWTTHIPGRCFVKLMTFGPHMKAVGERVLVMDLDVIVTGNMDAIVDRYEPIVLWRNPTRVPWDNPSKPSRPYYNTSIVLHRTGTLTDLWMRFNPKRPIVRDDQWWVSGLLGPNVPYWDASHGIYRIAREDTPGSGVQGTLPENARIVFFPGSEGKATDPRVIAANPWIEGHWK
ncbi:hypothetical protein [Aquamicrobium sp.]|uniref:hypothetical protein n=1 Tax=Aquamicrobium sp. TaxID=1872579 RepID=UPI00258D1AB6|nr:hypothetical protein [Aquamicrobium sp.]MCK9549126.1 hypothetical protein [Aquamicrobium sp.]